MTVFVFFNDKARELVLRKVKTKKSEAEIKKETILADDVSIDTLIKRIEHVTNDYILQMARTSESEKQKFEYKAKMQHLQQVNKDLLRKIEANCTNNCIA